MCQKDRKFKMKSMNSWQIKQQLSMIFLVS